MRGSRGRMQASSGITPHHIIAPSAHSGGPTALIAFFLHSFILFCYSQPTIVRQDSGILFYVKIFGSMHGSQTTHYNTLVGLHFYFLWFPKFPTARLGNWQLYHQGPCPQSIGPLAPPAPSLGGEEPTGPTSLVQCEHDKEPLVTTQSLKGPLPRPGFATVPW